MTIYVQVDLQPHLAAPGRRFRSTSISAILFLIFFFSIYTSHMPVKKKKKSRCVEVETPFYTKTSHLFPLLDLQMYVFYLKQSGQFSCPPPCVFFRCWSVMGNLYGARGQFRWLQQSLFEGCAASVKHCKSTPPLLKRFQRIFHQLLGDRVCREACERPLN